jgi:hypothetical protein
MALLPTGYVVSCRGTGVAPLEQIGAAALGITDATTVTTGNPYTQTLNFKDSVTNSVMSTRRSRAIAASGTFHTYSAQKALTAGTFAYDPNAFLIQGYSTTINGIANTSLLFTDGDQYRLRRSLIQKSWGYKYSTAIRAGYFSFTKISGKRTNWTTAPSSLNDTFRSTTNNAVAAGDQGQFVTYRSVPGELVYMQGSLTPFLDDYKATTG